MALDVVAPQVAERVGLSVEGVLLFLETPLQRPFVSFTYDSSEPETNAVYAPRIVPIRDARPIAPDLDIEGFELAQRASSVTDFSDEEQISTVGRAEAAQLVADATGASRVHVFDHTIRRAAPGAPRQPSTRVHNDYTPFSAANRVRNFFGEEAEALIRRPFAFINVWRPIRRPAIDWPLALCDARSVSAGELVPTDIVYPDRRGEIYGVVYSPRQRWFYFPEMRTDEALLIKCHDTRPGAARFAPHTSFRNPLAPPGTPPRESIEFRAMAFFG
jgi:hypothetical protein